MVTQRRHLRLLPCHDCGHMRASHYLLAPTDGRLRRHFSRPRDRSTPMPCHVLGCACGRFVGETQTFLCPVCTREYATRASLEIHLYGHHPELTPRERSILLHGAMSGHVVLSAAVMARIAVQVSGGEVSDSSAA
jgi:hypothetical protein